MKLFLHDEDIEILMKKYGDPISNEINYVVILSDAKEAGEDKHKVNYQTSTIIFEKEKEFVPTLSSANNFYTYQTHFLNIDFNLKDTLDKIKHRVKTNRIRLSEFFEDFDKLRKGITTKAKFRTALDMSNLGLRTEEYDLLEKVYEVENEKDLVYYYKMLEEVNTVFTLKNLEKSPNIRPKEFKMPDFLDPKQRLTKDENEFFHQVMLKLAELMKKYRVLPKVYFKDADKAKIGIIPSSKFASILSFLKLNVEEKEMNILIKRFHAESNIEINYFDFDHELQEYVKLTEQS